VSESPPRHAAAEAGGAGPPHPDDDPQSGLPHLKATRTVRFWTVPIVVTLAVLAALAAFYLGGILQPMTNLRHFPIAVVNQDAGPTGARVVKNVLSSFEKDDAYDVRMLSHDEAKRQLDTAQIYGVAVIPPNFSSKLQAFAKSALSPGRVERPLILVSTNPRAGTLGSSIASQTLTRALTLVDRRVGEELSREVAQQAGQRPMPGAVTLMLLNPIEVETVVHRGLPDGTGNGLSAFYYSLLLVLGGFTGSIVVGMLVDSMLGFVPAEFGPVYRFAQKAEISRFRTLLAKWALMVVLALLTSGVYMLVASRLGMPIEHGLPLWLYGAFAIAAVGVTSTSLIAVLGALGLLVSLFVFVIIGLPSAGATVPLEAAPQFFGWLAKFEPMHQVFLGARSLLYLDGRPGTGLSQSLTMTAIGLVIGLLLGGVLTWIYDRRGYHRIPPGLETSVEPASTPQ
jgi:YhgE/Pip-like protein